MNEKRIIHQGLPVHAEVEDAALDPDRPNILLICADQLRADALGIHGHPLIQTPQIDQIALGGVRFEHALSECPVCCPARRILMTGRNPYGVHMNYNRDLQPFPEGPKLAELVSAAGYQTHAVGKLHIWPPRNRMGFHDIEANEEGRTAGHTHPDDYQQFLVDHGLAPSAHAHGLGNNEYGVRMSPLPEWATTTGWTADRAMRFLRRRDPERPFLLYVSFDKPHPPATPPEEYYSLYRDTVFPEPVRGNWVDEVPLSKRAQSHFAHNWPQYSGRPDVFQHWMRGYAAMITHIDSRIGQILGTLRETDVLSNTWIVFTADHGDHCMDHELLAKGDFLAGSCRVPLFVRPPDTALGTVRDDRISSSVAAPAGLQDFLPTLCDIAGADSPGDSPGRSVLPHLQQESPDWRGVLCGNIGVSYAAQSATHRYLWFSDTGSELMFDLDADPKNEHNLLTGPAPSGPPARRIDPVDAGAWRPLRRKRCIDPSPPRNHRHPAHLPRQPLEQPRLAGVGFQA